MKCGESNTLARPPASPASARGVDRGSIWRVSFFLTAAPLFVSNEDEGIILCLSKDV